MTGSFLCPRTGFLPFCLCPHHPPRTSQPLHCLWAWPCTLHRAFASFPLHTGSLPNLARGTCNQDRPACHLTAARSAHSMPPSGLPWGVSCPCSRAPQDSVLCSTFELSRLPLLSPASAVSLDFLLPTIRSQFVSPLHTRCPVPLLHSTSGWSCHFLCAITVYFSVRAESVAIKPSSGSQLLAQCPHTKMSRKCLLRERGKLCVSVCSFET